MDLFDKDKYVEKVKDKMERAKILYEFPMEYFDTINELLDKKEKIIKENSIFAEFKLNLINKKINKIKKSIK